MTYKDARDLYQTFESEMSSNGGTPRFTTFEAFEAKVKFLHSTMRQFAPSLKNEHEATVSGNYFAIEKIASLHSLGRKEGCCVLQVSKPFFYTTAYGLHLASFKARKKFAGRGGFPSAETADALEERVRSQYAGMMEFYVKLAWNLWSPARYTLRVPDL